MATQMAPGRAAPGQKTSDHNLPATATHTMNGGNQQHHQAAMNQQQAAVHAQHQQMMQSRQQQSVIVSQQNNNMQSATGAHPSRMAQHQNVAVQQNQAQYQQQRMIPGGHPHHRPQGLPQQTLQQQQQALMQQQRQQNPNMPRGGAMHYQQQPQQHQVPHAQHQVQQQQPQVQQQHVQHQQTQQQRIAHPNPKQLQMPKQQRSQPQYAQQQQQQQRTLQHHQVGQPQANNRNTINHMHAISSQTSLLSQGSSTAERSSLTNTPLYDRLVSEEVKDLKEYIRITENLSRRVIDLEKIHFDLDHRLEEEQIKVQNLEHTLRQREKTWKAHCDKLKSQNHESNKLIREEKLKVNKLMDMNNRMQNDIRGMIMNKFSHDGGRGGVGGYHQNQNNYMQGMGGLTPSSSYSGNVKRVTSGQAAVSSSFTGGINRTSSSSAAHNSPGNEGGSLGGENGNTTPGRNSRRDNSNASGSAGSAGRHISPHEILAHDGSAEAVRERNAVGSLLDFFGM